ncbi:MAG TPA: sigma-70 family RNA polymerase sigma factor [Streptosporangiaceae bacterium]|nr:sigma-70 family RNA polymerase sigma factor [Streptosporangiaceae bacterium]
MVRMGSTSRVGWLVRASADGDEAAWTELVHQYAPLVMAVIRTYKLAPADAQDVSQTVWLRLVEHLANLREPEALPGWLTVTTRRACTRHLQRGRWEQPVDPHCDERIEVSTMASLDAGLLRAELRQALRDGLAELDEKDQRLLRLRTADPPMSYAEISELLGMKIGSIGPSLRRCLDRLKDTSAMRAYAAAILFAEEREGDDRHELVRMDR